MILCSCNRMKLHVLHAILAHYMHYYMDLHPAGIHHILNYILPYSITCSIKSITCSITSCLNPLHDLLQAQSINYIVGIITKTMMLSPATAAAAAAAIASPARLGSARARLAVLHQLDLFFWTINIPARGNRSDVLSARGGGGGEHVVLAQLKFASTN